MAALGLNQANFGLPSLSLQRKWLTKTSVPSLCDVIQQKYKDHPLNLLDLSQNALDSRGIQRLVSNGILVPVGTSKCVRLVSLRLCNVGIDELAIVHMGKFLMNNSILKLLDLSYNAIGDKGGELLLKFLCRSGGKCHLKHLDIASTGITQKTSKRIEETFFDRKEENPLESLNVAVNPLRKGVDSLILAISRCKETSLKSLKISLRRRGGKDNTPSALPALAGTPLRSLSLLESVMSKPDAQCLALLLEKSESLTSLSLIVTNMHPGHLTTIFRNISQNTTLSDICLRGNPQIGLRGAQFMAENINVSLHHLEMSDCGLVDSGINAFVTFLQTPTRCSLETLNLRGNNFSTYGRHALIVALKENTTIHRLGILFTKDELQKLLAENMYIYDLLSQRDVSAQHKKLLRRNKIFAEQRARVAFLLGLNERVGENSPIFRSYFSSPLFEPETLGIVRTFLSKKLE